MLHSGRHNRTSQKGGEIMTVTITVPVKLKYEARDDLDDIEVYEKSEKIYEAAKSFDFDFPDFSECEVDIN